MRKNQKTFYKTQDDVYVDVERHRELRRKRRADGSTPVGTNSGFFGSDALRIAEGFLQDPFMTYISTGRTPPRDMESRGRIPSLDLGSFAHI